MSDVHALTAHSDALFAEHVGDASLGDAVVIADLLSGLADLVAMHNVGDVLGGQEALAAAFWAVLGR